MYGARQVGDAKILAGLLTPALVKAMAAPPRAK